MWTRAAVVIVVGWSATAFAVPKVTWGSSQATRKVDAKALDRVLQSARDKLANCTSGEGTAHVKFTIGADGKVIAPKVTGVSEDVSQCVSTTLLALVFAKPADGKPVQITVPLTFHPAEIQTGAFASLTGSGDVSSGFDDSNIYGGLLGNEAGEMDGGFGYGQSGFGPGGGGTGVGTIGTGRYGVIGHGSGTGSGYGVSGGRGGMRGRTAAVPTVSIGQPTVQGDLDKAIVRRYIKRNIQKITYCYEKVLLGKPGLKGTVTADFTIVADGTVTTSKASGMKNADVESCIADVIKGIEFPKPKSDKVVVDYPFTFRPAEDESDTAAVGDASAHTSVSNLAVGQPVVEGDMDKTIVRRYVTRSSPKIQDCYEKRLAKKKGIEGTVSTEFTINADGTVSSANAKGVDPDVDTCVAAVIKTIEFPKPAGRQTVTAHMPLTFHPVAADSH